MELLISTPVTPIEVMIGKLVPYFVIGLLDAAFCLADRGALVRGAVPRHVRTLFIATSLFLVVVLGIGYLISVRIRSQIGASQIALLVTMLPTTLLSGYMFPIDQMPAADPGPDLSRLFALLRHHPQGDVPQGRPALPSLPRRSWRSSSGPAVIVLAARAFHKTPATGTAMFERILLS